MNLDSIYLIVKIALIIFSLLHFLAMVLLYRQVALAIRTVATHNRNKVRMMFFGHLVFLLIVLILIVILPV